jgi:hypothetical protein
LSRNQENIIPTEKKNSANPQTRFIRKTPISLSLNHLMRKKKKGEARIEKDFSIQEKYSDFLIEL